MLQARGREINYCWKGQSQRYNSLICTLGHSHICKNVLTVNTNMHLGQRVDSENGSAFVSADDSVRVGNIQLSPHQEISFLNTRLFLCNKLVGELVTYKDDFGRPTVFQRLERMRVMLTSVQRLTLECFLDSYQAI